MITAASLSHRAHPARQFVRFLIVGGCNTLLAFVVYGLLLLIDTPYAVAAPLAFCVGAANGYVFNRRWTFAARDSTRARVLYVVIAAAGAITTTFFVLAYVRGADVDRFVAYLLAIVPVTVATFLANRRWTFADRDEQTMRDRTSSPDHELPISAKCK